ncbi:MAG TPA: FKBP-type peptidyl-prolyl cis-trans isomerase [Lacunisphaera sp.]|jgi:FKBP-type peptidyl-prolyl cis-trans isomerase FklB|nr:FKBP-type peptidyl-prolyl cis-trans isomerase [Lacunisphaera sp.]
MNRTTSSVSLLLVLGALTFSGCGKPSTSSQSAPAAAVPAVVTLDSVDQKVSYGIGYNMGVGLARDGALTVDQAALIAGLADGLAKAKTRVPEPELETAFMALQQKMAAAAAAAGEKQLALGNDYLAKNKAKPGVTVTASGLQYEVIKGGSGPKPAATSTVKVHYHGTLIDGKVFDSSVERKEPIEFALNQVIAGWTEGLQLMSVGDKWRLTIPPAIGYGVRGKGDIPPNAVLIFEVELLEIK